MGDFSVILTHSSNKDLYTSQSLIDELVQETILKAFNIQKIADLQDFIPAGKRVLIKPNWVFHKPAKKSNLDCLVTNKSIVISILRILEQLQFEEVIIGDSPIQLCDFDHLVTKEYQAELRDQTKAKISFVDFRRYIPRINGDLSSGLMENRTKQNYILFDLKNESYLEPITHNSTSFQITNYDTRDIKKHHNSGKHEYLICKEILESDLVINLPKLKMHNKAGFSGATKNFIGCVGDKTYLPHHRLGGNLIGGDSFPGLHPFIFFAELALNQRNKTNQNNSRFYQWDQIARLLMKVDRNYSLDRHYKQGFAGSWKGNDTIWRTVLDVFRIIESGDTSGSILKNPQRVIWTLADGIIIGAGNGPLAPSPYNLGVLTFSTSVIAQDIVHGYLLGYKPEEVPFFGEITRQINPETILIKYQQQVQQLYDFLISTNLNTNISRPDNW